MLVVRVAALLLCLISATLAHAGAQRTFVASTGSDTSPCTLIMPCRSFAAAIAAVAVSGEVVVLDSAGYGPFEIIRSVSVTAPPGVYAGISVPTGTDGIVIDTPGVIVALRGLTINGHGGNSGINFLQGAELSVENCEVANIGGVGATAGILAQAPGGRVVIRDTIIRNAAVAGIWVAQATPGQTTTVVIDHVAIHNCQIGIYVGGIINLGGRAEAYLTRVTVTGSSYVGIGAETLSGGTALVSVTDSTLNGNGTDGVSAAGFGAKLTVATSTVAGNSTFGFGQYGLATLLSRGDNTVHDNNGGGAQTTGTIGSISPL